MNEIDAAAADWVSRFDGAEPGPEAKRALDAWLAADRRHVGAFARAQAMLIAYDDMALEDAGRPTAARSMPAAPDRRRLLWGAGMAAGVVALGGGVWFASADAAYATALGERRVIGLKDGNRLTLNTQSRVHVSDGGDVCRVRFLEGEILVETGSRPIAVTCGDARVSAANAMFGVRRQPAQTIMTVIKGEVSVEGLAAPVAAGGRVRLDQATPSILPPLDAVAVERSLAWRSGRLAFEGETLREAVAEFRRYSATPIVLVGGATGDRRIVGLFAADDPVAFAQAVAVTSGLRAQTRDGGVYLSEPVS